MLNVFLAKINTFSSFVLPNAASYEGSFTANAKKPSNYCRIIYMDSRILMTFFQIKTYESKVFFGLSYQNRDISVDSFTLTTAFSNFNWFDEFSFIIAFMNIIYKPKTNLTCLVSISLSQWSVLIYLINYEICFLKYLSG